MRPTSWFPVFLLALAATACRSSRFEPASPEDPNAMRTCTGVVTEIRRAPEAGVDVVIGLEPRAEDAFLLAPGQEFLPCAVLTREDSPFDRILPMVQVGKRLEVSGYHVLDRTDGRHYLRPVTSLDPFPDK